jgi:hypothetical protein
MFFPLSSSVFTDRERCNIFSSVAYVCQLLYAPEISLDLFSFTMDGLYRRSPMNLVRKTIELDQDRLTRIKLALKAQTEKEALNEVTP